MPNAVDWQLLFGLLALQNGLIDQAKLVAAFQAWTLDRSRSLADHLVGLGHLDEGRRSAIEVLVRFHVQAHGGDVEQSLASVPVGQSTRVLLGSIADPDLSATITHLGRSGTDPDATGTFHAGSATANGGRFQVLRQHARGGLGSVFVALDTELNREVALKQILDQHADDPRLRGRFLVEAEITGGLEHPGIVPVYGLGAYGDGRPYYAMRFVRGDTLREAVDAFHKGAKSDRERSLRFRQILKRFTDICNAIDYAHSRGVLHRDIKPGNVIVGKHGETLVVDWGLAKPLGQSAPDAVERTLMPSSGDGSSETLPGQALGTPAYMSPEQARGDIDRLGPRSDVYSLGATLYYLITGQAPFQGQVDAILKAVEAGDFRKPRERDGSIDPALEAIVLKAMALDPAERYGSARMLAEEIDRWLADERVEAYAEPWTRTLNRWLTRHRTGVTGIAAAGIVALVGLAIVSTVQTRAKRVLDAKNVELRQANVELAESNQALDLQRKRAEANEAEAIDAVKRFKDAIADNPELKNNPELESLRKTLLKEPLAFFGKLRERLQADHDARPESLAKLADVAHAHALLNNEIGDKLDAIQAFQESIAIEERLAHDQPAVTQYQADLATGHNNLGLLLSDTGHPDEARTAYERAIAIQERLVRDQPAVTDHQAPLADSHNNLGNLLSATGHPDGARTAYERAIAIEERLARDQPAVIQYHADLANSHNNLGVLLQTTGHPDGARTAYERAIAIRERLVRDQPAVTQYQASLAMSHNNLGLLLSATGHPDEARTAYERAIAIEERLARDQPAVTQYQADLANSHNNLGVLLQTTGHPDEARTAYERAVAIRERLARDQPAVTQYQARLAMSHNNLGLLLRATGHPDEARTAYERAVAIEERLARDQPKAPDHASGLGGSLNNLAGIDLDASRFAEAREKLLEAVSWQQRALDANPKHSQYRQFYQNHLNSLILAERGLGHDDEAARIGHELAEFQLNDPKFGPLDARLKAVLNGEGPKDNAERLQLAQRAYDTKRFAAAARLWGEALDSDPKLAEDRQTQHPYNAACAAALASDGQGEEPPGDDAEKARLRGRALVWLQAERDFWAKLLESGPSQVRPVISQTLKHWQEDPDLASVREADSLAKLPEAEREAWQGLWAGVAELLRKVQ